MLENYQETDIKLDPVTGMSTKVDGTGTLPCKVGKYWYCIPGTLHMEYKPSCTLSTGALKSNLGFSVCRHDLGQDPC